MIEPLVGPGYTMRGRVCARHGSAASLHLAPSYI